MSATAETWSQEAVDFLQAVADTKLLLGFRYAERMSSGQSIEDDVANMNVAQEEFGHVRQLFSILEEQGRSHEWLNADRDAGTYANASVLDDPAGDWTTFVVETGMVDRAAWLLLDAVSASELDGIREKIAQEESFHLERADAWFEHLAETDPEAVEAVLEEAVPQVLSFIGPASYDDETDPLAKEGFTDATVADLREQFIAHYRALCEETEVDFDVADTDAPDLDAWDAVRRRQQGGAISAETVAVVQGTENREFAME
ncbi:MAG: Phenylacetic acid catabolic protein [Haloferacaceae archaeon]